MSTKLSWNVIDPDLLLDHRVMLLVECAISTCQHPQLAEPGCTCMIEQAMSDEPTSLVTPCCVETYTHAIFEPGLN